MQSTVTNVDAYLAEAPAERRAALERIRTLCRATFPDADEGIDYGMAVYKRHGVMHVAFASQKSHIAIYGSGAKAVDRHKSALRGVELGKGCVRFRKPDAIDFVLVQTMMDEARERSGSVC